MFRNMKLGAKIACGFGIVLLITVALGTVTIWNITEVKDKTIILDKEYVPQVDVIIDLEQNVRNMMYHLRGYGYTGDNKFLASSDKSVEEIQKDLAAAKNLAIASPHLVKLKEAVGTLEAKLNEYYKLTDQTKEKVEALARNRKILDETSAEFMKHAYAYLNSQNKKMAQNIQTGAEAVTLTERLEKITLINDIIDLGNLIRISNFKAQALRDSKITQEALVHFPEIDQKVSDLLAKTTQDIDKTDLTELVRAAHAYQAAMSDPSSNWQALFETNDRRRDAGNAALVITEEVAKTSLQRIDKTSEETLQSLSSVSRMVTVGLGLAVLLGATLAFFITRNITRPINRIIAGLNEGAEQVPSASGQVSAASQSLAEGASEQAASLEETSSSLEEMSSMTQQNAGNAGQADTLMKEASRVVGQANDTMTELTKSMDEITRASEETSKIVKTIDEIAFQTNLLALNAAVEAARAGDAGAGFAVVADEVRNLAMRAADAAKNTANLIEGTVKKVKEGADLVNKTNEAFMGVSRSAAKVGELVAEIAVASNEQATGISQVNKAVAQMDKVIQQNASGAEENASASEEMNAQAEQMKEFVAELSAVVGGSNGGSHQNARREAEYTQAPVQKSAGYQALSAPNRTGGAKRKALALRGEKKTLAHSRGEVSPGELIPLDEDFESF